MPYQRGDVFMYNGRYYVYLGKRESDGVYESWQINVRLGRNQVVEWEDDPKRVSGWTPEQRIPISQMPFRAEAGKVSCVHCGNGNVRQSRIVPVCHLCRRWANVRACPFCFQTDCVSGGNTCDMRRSLMCINCGHSAVYHPSRQRLAVPLGMMRHRARLCSNCAAHGLILCRKCKRNAVKAHDQHGKGDDYGWCQSCHENAESVWFKKSPVGGPPFFFTRSPRIASVEMEVFVDNGKKSWRAKKGKVRMPAWEQGHDGSIRVPSHLGSNNAVELRSPPVWGDKGILQLRKDIQAIRQCGFRGNRSCGVHVHVDATGLRADEVQNLRRFMAWYEDEMFELVTPSRRTNEYCWSLKSSPPRGNRYCWFNTDAYNKYGTVEFRLHQGVTDAKRIAHWTCLCMALVEAGIRNLNKRVKPSAGLLEIADLTSAQRTYWTKVKEKMASITAAVNGGNQ